MAGGSTVLSGGIVYATGSRMQKAAGVEDSVEDLVKYWSDRADGQNDPEFLRFVAERSGETIDWLVITSYSIHYTKLYEDHRFHPWGRA